MNGGGFTDLRINPQDGGVSENFWPSFTDIMTTVVMIFLIALVVLLARNIELVQQLRSTMEAERIAAELARATGEEKDSLSLALGDAEERMQQMRLEIMRLHSRGERRENIIAEQLIAISDLSRQRDELNEQASSLMLLRQRLEADVENQKARLRTATDALKHREFELQAARTDVDNLQANLVSLEGSLHTSQQQTALFQERLSQKRQELDASRQANLQTERQYQTLSGDYDSLKIKYDKLVRPARSAKGRHRIEVRYQKDGGQYKIAWREAGQDEFNTVQRTELDAVLTRIDQAHSEGLYIKVIFPEKSGLSYNEAWKFTTQLHRNFDYYFKKQSEPVKNTPAEPTLEAATDSPKPNHDE
jgi:DNA repair exonuclease SbcCD ATPase subunit